MFRKLVGVTAVAMLLCVSAVLAEDVKGKVTKVDADNSKITITVDGKDTEYTVAKDAKMPKGFGKEKDKEMDLAGLAKMVERNKDRGGVGITAVTNDKKVVTEIKLERMGKGKKDKDK